MNSFCVTSFMKSQIAKIIVPALERDPLSCDTNLKLKQKYATCFKCLKSHLSEIVIDFGYMYVHKVHEIRTL